MLVIASSWVFCFFFFVLSVNAYYEKKQKDVALFTTLALASSILAQV